MALKNPTPTLTPQWSCFLLSHATHGGRRFPSLFTHSYNIQHVTVHLYSAACVTLVKSRWRSGRVIGVEMGGAGILNTVKDKKPECVRAVKFCRGLLGTFSSDDEHVNVNYRKLENEPWFYHACPNKHQLVVHTSLRTPFATICRPVVNVSSAWLIFFYFLT